ncbi:MAG TPA: ABC transporter permease [Ktedonobacterales bacterium]|jgi:general nucleoside transport system permease protein|nr:ABC transporter permease [Ktedonobacterales bacterium]
MNVIGSILHLLATGDFWQSTLKYSVLLLLPALGGVISERSGVVNIAMEGMMLTGAFFAVVFDLAWHNPWLATLAAVISGGLVALIHAVVSIRFKADQIISGIAINIFAAGLTTFLLGRIYGQQGVDSVPRQNTLPTVNVPLLDQLPFLGKALFQQNVIVYLALVLLVLINFALFRTKLGLRLRAVGEHPQAADTAGINVYVLRYGAVISSGLLSALSGAFLSIGIGNIFVQNMTSGRGYIALAAMIFGKWTPYGAFVSCLIFGAGEALFDYNSSLSISSYFVNMVPYVLTLIVLAGFVGRSIPPAADGIPYEPGGE